ncbi:MAG: J domain-containing protein, partial [Acidimicrobiia bacterium]
MARTLYDVLGVTVTATPDELRQAYRDRARQLHPDRVRARGGRDTDAIGAAMREVNEAWRVLRDPAARLAYDRTLLPSPGPDDELDELDRPFRGRPAEPGDVVVTLVRALPWVLVLLVLGGIFV